MVTQCLDRPREVDNADMEKTSSKATIRKGLASYSRMKLSLALIDSDDASPSCDSLNPENDSELRNSGTKSLYIDSHAVPSEQDKEGDFNIVSKFISAAKASTARLKQNRTYIDDLHCSGKERSAPRLKKDCPPKMVRRVKSREVVNDRPPKCVKRVESRPDVNDRAPKMARRVESLQAVNVGHDRPPRIAKRIESQNESVGTLLTLSTANETSPSSSHNFVWS